MLAQALMRVMTAKQVILKSGTDANLFALAGSPTARGRFNFIIPQGVTIGQVAAAAAIVVGQFPAGSIIDIWNYGDILARGGAGGSYPNAGQAGGDALKADYGGVTMRLHNFGNIKAGGGGGGSGGWGGAGGIGGWGNAYYVSPWYWYHDNENHSQWVYYTTPGINEIAWYNDPTPNGGGGSTADITNCRYLADGQLLTRYGIFERGDYRGEYNDSPQYGHYYSYNVRLSRLYEPGAPAGRTPGGTGGNGQGYNQNPTVGGAGVASIPGNNGTGGSGAGGASGASGVGGNGGEWASAGTPGAYGSQGGTGGDGVYRTLPEVTRFGEGGGVSAGGGAAGRAIVKGGANFTIDNQGTIIGATV